MNFGIYGHNCEVSDSTRNYVEKKLGGLDRYLPTLSDARVDIREEQAARKNSDRYVVQVTLHDSHGTILRGEERASEVPAAVDAVAGKLHRQIVRFKGKRKDRYHRAGSSNGGGDPLAELDVEVEADDEENGEPQIVRTKRFAMAPMNAEEAVEQMELLGHTFFAFYNVNSGNVNVVYRRRDGNYGLIMPDLV
jgi:putative sigma-54 modulation protein